MSEAISKVNSLFQRPWRHLLLVSAIFLLLTILFTFPLALRMTTHIPGYSGDINYYYWSNWWFGEAMSRGTNPWWTDMLWSPNGTSLVFSTNRFVSAFFSWLIEPLIGQIAAYNISILLSFVVSALGVYLFARELTGNSMAAFAAAFIFTFNPWKFHKLQCHHFLMSTWFFGFALWMLVRIVQREEKSIKHGLLLGLFAAITIYESLFLFDLLFLALVLVLLWFALFNRTRFWRKSTLKSLLTAGLVFLVLATPMLVMIATALPEYGTLPYAPGGTEYSTDLLNIIWPSPMPWSEFGAQPKTLWTEINHHYRGHDENFSPLGWILIPLMIIGWWIGRRKHKALANVLIFGVLFFTVLSLGPALHIAGSNTEVPLLYKFLSWLPPFGLVRTPSRFIIITYLFAGILAAMAIAHIVRKMNRWKFGWLLPAGLAVLLFIDYMPHGSATQDQRKYPKTLDALAAVDGNFAVMPFGYRRISIMRYAPIHGKAITAGYVARDTLFSQPIQDTAAHLLSSLLKENSKASSSTRKSSMVKTVRTFLRSANIGAILHLGSEKRLKALAGLLQGEILSKRGEHGVILLPRGPYTSSSLTINADTWPPMPEANLGGGAQAKQLWTGFNGFRLAIPSAFMPEETIELTVSSAVRDLRQRRHFLLINVNAVLTGRIELSPKNSTYSVRLPENIRRLPMNIVTITQEFGPKTQDSRLPFKITALSGNLPAGNYAALSIDAQELLPYERRNASLILATINDFGSPSIKGVFPIHEADFVIRFEQAFRDALAQPWAVIIACGEISPAAAELVETISEEAGIELARQDIRARSFVGVIDTQAGSVIAESFRDGYILLHDGAVRNPVLPTVNIKEIAFR